MPWEFTSDTIDLANYNKLALECSLGSGILNSRLWNDLVDVDTSVFEKGLQNSKGAAVQNTVLVMSVEYLSVANEKQLDYWTYNKDSINDYNLFISIGHTNYTSYLVIYICK